MPTTRVPAPTDPAHGPFLQVDAEVRGLVSRVQGGDQEAFGRLYDRYATPVFRFVYGQVGNRQVAEDLTSETFLQALRGIQGFAWQSGFLPWLMAIAKRRTIDYWRAAARRERPVGDMRTESQADLRLEADPERAVVERLAHLDVLASVHKLPEAQRRCIVLRILRDLSLEETARILGRTVPATKNLQRRALNALRTLVPAQVVMPA